MPRLIKRSRKKVGLSPGTLIHVGDQKVDKIKISLINYDEGQLLEKELINIEDSFPYKDTPPVTWIDHARHVAGSFQTVNCGGDCAGS